MKMRKRRKHQHLVSLVYMLIRIRERQEVERWVRFPTRPWDWDMERGYGVKWKWED